MMAEAEDWTMKYFIAASFVFLLSFASSLIKLQNARVFTSKVTQMVSHEFLEIAASLLRVNADKEIGISVISISSS